MSRATSRKEAKSLLGDVEGHHIYPKSIIKNNKLVFLSIKEHFICHWLLTKMLTGEEQKKMFGAMSYMTYRKSLSSFETQKCMSFKHKPCSDQRRENIQKSRIKTEKIECIYCGRSTDPGNFKQYHGENCKLNPNISRTILEKRSERNRTSTLKSIKNGTHKHRSPTSYGTLSCPHCGKIGSNIGSMKKHHFDNCTTITGKQSKMPGYLPKCSCIICRKEVDMANFGRHKCE